MKIIITFLTSILLAGCSMIGDGGAEIAPYKVVRQDSVKNIEVREYNRMILVSTPMVSADGRNNAFRVLFAYITGDNKGQQDIAMTAPVFMDKENNTEGTKIPMTAPVFMDTESTQPMMSFVMPADFTLETTPKPTNPAVTVREITDYKVATIKFSGRLTDKNTNKHQKILEEWLASQQDYKVTGPAKTAGYDAPFTLPAMRRNEVLIPVE